MGPRHDPHLAPQRGARYRSILAGEAPTTDYEDFGYLHGELTGKRVGLIGCGHIGRRLVKYLQPFEVDIRVYDPYLASEMPDAIGVVKTSLENVLSKSDVIVCLAPITPATEGMIGRRELDMIRPNSVFVNVSRGAIVDSDALITRLKRGDIVAGLDVFDPEPIPPDSEIIGLPNTFLSPHIAGVTLASNQRFFTLMVDELERFFQGDEPLNPRSFQARPLLNPRSLANRRTARRSSGHRTYRQHRVGGYAPLRKEASKCCSSSPCAPCPTAQQSRTPPVPKEPIACTATRRPL